MLQLYKSSLNLHASLFANDSTDVLHVSLAFCLLVYLSPVLCPPLPHHPPSFCFCICFPSVYVSVSFCLSFLLSILLCFFISSAPPPSLLFCASPFPLFTCHYLQPLPWCLIVSGVGSIFPLWWQEAGLFRSSPHRKCRVSCGMFETWLCRLKGCMGVCETSQATEHLSSCVWLMLYYLHSSSTPPPNVCITDLVARTLSLGRFGNAFGCSSASCCF